MGALLILTFVSGFVLGIVVIIAAEALGVSIILKKLKKRTQRDEVKSNAYAEHSEPDPHQSLEFLSKKQGCVWILESVPEDFMDKAPKEQKKRRDFLEVFPVKKHAKIQDSRLFLLESDGSKKAVQLKGCTIEAVSATSLPSRKWVKRFPLKLENRTSVIYNESKTIFIFLETSWEKESWCKALRLASCADKERLQWFAKLHKEFHSYVSSLSTGYPSFMKPSAGCSPEAIDKDIKPNASSSKVRLFFKKLAKKTSKVGLDSKANSSSSLLEERKINEKFHPSLDSISSAGIGKGSSKVQSAKTCFDEDSISSSLSLTHSGSQSHASVISDADPDDKFAVDEGTLCWNLFLSRFFFDTKSNEAIIKSLHDRIQGLLSKMRTPSYVGEVVCTKIHPGNLPPNINAIKVLPFELNEVWALEVDFEYLGGFTLDIETRLEVQDLQKSAAASKSDPSYAGDVSSILEDFENLGKELSLSEETGQDPEDGNSKNPASSSSGGSRWKSLINSIAKQVSQVPISLAIKVASLRGTLRLQIKPPPSDQIWYGFTAMPDLDLRLESFVGDHKITSGHIALFLINRVKAVIRDTLVLPNFESLYIPFMMAEKDNWISREAAPFMWLNHGASDNKTTSETQKSHPIEAKSRTEGGGKTSSTNQREIEPRRPKTNVESSHSHSNAPSTSIPSSSTGNSVVGGALNEMKIPLLGNDREIENLQQNREDAPKNQSPSRSTSLFGRGSPQNEEDDTKTKRMGRRARMMEIGKKMGEKLEEKRRNIEEKSRNIVEKMRGP